MGDRSWRSGKVRALDGALVHYGVRPQSGASPERIAFIHALAMDRSNWNGVIAALPASFGALAVDCRGHGMGKGETRLSLDLMASDLAGILDEIGWDDAIVAGCSMGGCVAQAFAAAFPERTAGLVLIDTTAWYGPDAIANWQGRADKAGSEGLSALVPFQVDRWFAPDFRDRNADVVQQTLDVFLANDTGSYAAACAMLGRADLRPAVKDIRCPTAILVGEEDYATPISAARALHEAIPGSELTIIPGARHFTPIERPDAIAAAIARVQGRIAADRSTSGEVKQ